MKSYKINILILIIASIFWTCSDDDKPYKPTGSPFKVELEGGTNTVQADGGTLNLLIDGGTNGWWIELSENTNWCKPAKMYGAGDFKLPINITKNDTGKERKTILTIHSSFEKQTFEFSINQE